MVNLILIVHNVRSAHNVGSLLRTADGLGVRQVYLTGYTPYPKVKADIRLPHESARVSKRIEKTSLGAEKYVDWRQTEDIRSLIKGLKADGFKIIALEQATGSKKLEGYNDKNDAALIVGSERGGLSRDILCQCDEIIEIPMLGHKESFNVSVAGAMALYRLRYGH